MRRLMLVFCILCMSAQDVVAAEPFGAPVVAGNEWYRAKKHLVETAYAPEVRRIAGELAHKRGLALLGWVNQKVGLSPVIATDNQCAEKAIAKCAVLRLVDPAIDCRYVAGATAFGNNRTEPGHAMAAARVDGKWRMLDNKHVVAAYLTPTDEEVQGFRNPYFRADSVIKH